MTAYQRFQKLNIDHSVIGLDQNISGVNYFCTPIGAEVIAEAGVDGIHYCFINGFGDMRNEELFEKNIMDNKPDEKQRAIMDVIKEEFQIMPMEHPFYYIKGLQAAFDYGKLKFPEKYYEMYAGRSGNRDRGEMGIRALWIWL